jgi:hypothetical protein
MRARGLQHIVHHLDGGEDLSLPLRRVAALATGQPALEAAIAAALAAPRREPAAGGSTVALAPPSDDRARAPEALTGGFDTVSTDG